MSSYSVSNLCFSVILFLLIISFRCFLMSLLVFMGLCSILLICSMCSSGFGGPHSYVIGIVIVAFFLVGQFSISCVVCISISLSFSAVFRSFSWPSFISGLG